MDLFLVEFTVSDWPASVAWYRDRLGLAVDLRDEPNQYALLAAGSRRIALRAGTPSPGSTKLVFQVTDLTAESGRLSRAGVTDLGPVQTSGEGYRSLRLADPDGYRIELFEWSNPNAGRAV